jgi:UDP-N-acetylglucosamine 1-carboxyvinyltransferase
MPRLKIAGPCRLQGEVSVQGAKNSALPLLAASILCREECILHNCPQLSDVRISTEILRKLGCRVLSERDTICIDAREISSFQIPDDLMREMRSSIIFLGAILGRTGCAVLGFPGGCELGPRPIDLHLEALRKMGASIVEDHGRLLCETPTGLHGAHIALSFPSVGATENVLLAASCAKGTTLLENAAHEPEICDLADFLNSCGAKIHGAGGSTIEIEGVEQLGGCEHWVIPDRIAAATFLAAGAATYSTITLRDIDPQHLTPIWPVFEEAGCDLTLFRDAAVLVPPKKLHRIKHIRTMPYPGFPTDAQAPLMAMTTQCQGTSMFVENIFESRYKHVGELLRLGAHIRVDGRVAVVEGPSKLSGTTVEAADLRGGAALVVAGLAAFGETIVEQIHHIDRGYEAIERTLGDLGAQIRRLP